MTGNGTQIQGHWIHSLPLSNNVKVTQVILINVLNCSQTFSKLMKQICQAANSHNCYRTMETVNN